MQWKLKKTNEVFLAKHFVIRRFRVWPCGHVRMRSAAW
jgi:hypothetical protein